MSEAATAQARRASLPLSFAPGGALVAGCGNIGAAVSARLAAAGLPVMFTYRENAPRAAALEQRLAAHGGRALARPLDFLDETAVQRTLAEAARLFGRLHTVVYCAGPAIAFLKVRDMPPATMATHLTADTLGAFRLFHHAIPLLEEGGGGTLTACVLSLALVRR